MDNRRSSREKGRDISINFLRLFRKSDRGTASPTTRSASIEDLPRKSSKLSGLHKIKESIRRRCTRGYLDDGVQRSLSLDDVFLSTGFRLHCDGESPLARPDSNATVSLASSSSSGDIVIEDEVEDGESDMKRIRTFRSQKNVTNGQVVRRPRLHRSSSCGDVMAEVSAAVRAEEANGLRQSERPLQRFGSMETLKPTAKALRPKSLEDALTEFGTVYSLNTHLQAATEEMPSSWKDFVVDSKSLSTAQCKLQEAVWEAITRELSYLRVVKTLTYFLQALEAVQRAQYLSEVDGELLFGNIKEIRKSTDLFWHNYLRRVYTTAKESGSHLDPFLLAKAFSSMPTHLQPYVRFCSQQADRQTYFSTMKKENSKFTTYLQWCQEHEACNRQHLSDLLIQPLQHLTRYELLLAKIHEKSSQVAPEALPLLSEKHLEVKKFAHHVDNAKFLHEQQIKLQKIMESIDGYIRLEGLPSEAQEYLESQGNNKINLLADIPDLPMTMCRKRAVCHEGMVQTCPSSRSSSKVSAHMYLFTDFLLLTGRHRNSAKEKQKIIKPPMPIEKVEVQILNHEECFLLIHREDFGFIVNVVWINAITPQQALQWETEIKKAKNHLALLRAGKVKSTSSTNLERCVLPRTPKSLSSPDDIPLLSPPPRTTAAAARSHRKSGLSMTERDRERLVLPDSPASVELRNRHHRNSIERPTSVTSTFSQFSFNSVSSGYRSTSSSSDEEKEGKEARKRKKTISAQQAVHRSTARASLSALRSVQEDSFCDVAEEDALAGKRSSKRLLGASRSVDELAWGPDVGSAVV
ncbi:pleckstrin homology domain-containing family G member 6-like isoform X2 [Oscarella lobularis]|uniref:pleckstrin homology domain-containing family G member 6-like isoform X2 n=1 Tax=Oscarella lobularis TaxID=121494 RepID=UPI0033140E73